MSDSLYKTWDSDSQKEQAYAATADNVEAIAPLAAVQIR